MKHLLIVLAVAALSGCVKNHSDPLDPGQIRDPQTGKVYSNTVLLTTEDGCVVSDLYIRNEGTTKMIRCPNGEAGASWRSGKATAMSLSIPHPRTPPVPLPPPKPTSKLVTYRYSWAERLHILFRGQITRNVVEE